MSRYDVDMTIYNVAVTVDDRGVASTEIVDSVDVFANRYSIGTSAWAAARSVGLHADAEVAMRSIEYEGQQRASLDGIEYEVERARDTGEFTVLTLKRRLSNG